MKFVLSLCLAAALLALGSVDAGAAMGGSETPSGFSAADHGRGPWTLEFGPLIGSYHFDALTAFKDAPLFGARLGVRRSDHFQIEAEFTEVYTNRHVTGNSARQVCIALHGRGMKWVGSWQPSIMGGIAFVGLDDSEDPDSFGEAWDLGLGLGRHLNHHWMVRMEWMLRYQRFSLFDPNISPESQDERVRGTWAHSFLLGVHYGF